MRQECINAGIDRLVMKPVIDDEAWNALLDDFYN